MASVDPPPENNPRIAFLIKLKKWRSSCIRLIRAPIIPPPDPDPKDGVYKLY